MVTSPAVPEIYEDELHSAIEARSESLQTLRELGPPDLVHLIKQPIKSATKQVRSTFDRAYLRAMAFDIIGLVLVGWLQVLVQSLADQGSCYNAFSRLDMRVQVYIPGTVESYCIDERGDKRVATDELWLETYLCSVLRAYSYADDGSGDTIKKIVGVRRFNPITSTESEHRFLDAAERLFFNGWQLGSDPEIQVPNLVSNHLTTGLLNYIHTTGRYTSGINLFEKLRTRDPEISSLLARVYIEADEEVKAVQLLHGAIQELPMDYSLLDCQAEFCNKKGRGDLALEIAKRSVVSAPSEFGTWARLAEIYVSLEQWDLALLTLNSCPMFTYQDKDAPRMPEPQRVFLPIMPEAMCDEIEDSNVDDMELVHPTLRKLHAAGFKGTFLKAYILLTEITKKIGWDQLLKIRSQVFVMEEEYRHEKTVQQPHSRSASTTALRAPSPNSQAQQANGSEHGEVQERPSTDASNTQNGEGSAAGTETELEKPGHTVASEVVKAGSEDPHLHDNQNGNPAQPNYTHFQNKRLCERWLDNLFMVLYEDLRYRWYSEFSPALLYTIRKLIEEEGAVKIRSIVQGTSLPQHVLDLTHQYAALCAAFRSSGSDG
ncbi:hypothetical protein GGP41_009869 [Bipolaris sorokiniana]|uniref:Chaps-domain-containing protein n=1 Tax=Cochliobolus sativus TaxID=45130 RepID=A0A8H6DW66_COCSA|nr:hypothetical protein GGP41_009869 [Bipolaris sorokiniana]